MRNTLNQYSEQVRLVRARLGADVGLPIPGDAEALALFDGLVEQYGTLHDALTEIARRGDGYGKFREQWLIARNALREASPASDAEQQPVARDEHLESALAENMRLHSETRSLREQLEAVQKTLGYVLDNLNTDLSDYSDDFAAGYMAAKGDVLLSLPSNPTKELP